MVQFVVFGQKDISQPIEFYRSGTLNINKDLELISVIIERWISSAKVTEGTFQTLLYYILKQPTGLAPLCYFRDVVGYIVSKLTLEYNRNQNSYEAPKLSPMPATYLFLRGPSRRTQGRAHRTYMSRR